MPRIVVSLRSVFLIYKIDRIPFLGDSLYLEFLSRLNWTLAASGPAHMKLHSSFGVRIRATIDNFSHETHEKTRNIIFIFVRFRGFRGQQYSIQEIQDS